MTDAETIAGKVYNNKLFSGLEKEERHRVITYLHNRKSLAERVSKHLSADASLDRPMSQAEYEELSTQSTRQGRIITQGEKEDTLYLIVHGRASVEHENQGRRTKIGLTLAPGDFMGEMALFTGEPRSASLYAIDTTYAFAISKEDYLALGQDLPKETLKISNNIIRVGAERLKRTNRALAISNEVKAELTLALEGAEEKIEALTTQNDALRNIHKSPTTL